METPKICQRIIVKTKTEGLTKKGTYIGTVGNGFKVHTILSDTGEYVGFSIWKFETDLEWKYVFGI